MLFLETKQYTQHFLMSNTEHLRQTLGTAPSTVEQWLLHLQLL